MPLIVPRALPNVMKKPVQQGIYVITNTITQEQYVGSTINLSHRWQHHKHYLKTSQHHNKLLQISWGIYGEEVFSIRLIEYVAKPDDLLSREEFYITTLAPKFNLTDKPKRWGHGRRTTEANEESRLWANVRKEYHGCWIWTGTILRKKSGSLTPMFRTVSTAVSARRAVYEKVLGLIPADFILRNTCGDNLCVNPEHQVSCNKSPEACPKGHLYTPENTAYSKSRWPTRICRTCHREKQKQYTKPSQGKAKETKISL